MSGTQQIETQVFVVQMWDDSDHSSSGKPHWKGRVKYLTQDGAKASPAIEEECRDSADQFEEKAFNTLAELLLHITEWLERAHVRAQGSADRRE